MSFLGRTFNTYVFRLLLGKDYSSGRTMMDILLAFYRRHHWPRAILYRHILSLKRILAFQKREGINTSKNLTIYPILVCKFSLFLKFRDVVDTVFLSYRQAKNGGMCALEE